MTPRQRLIKEIQIRLGGGMIDLEADPVHYDLAVTMALDRYRQRSGNSMEESFIFVDTTPGQDTYTLPNEIQLVRYAYRRGIGSNGGTGAIDPFSLAFTNNLYLLSGSGGGGGTSSGGTGSLATYDLAMGFQELAGRLFGREVIFSFSQTSHTIQFHRKFGGIETILLHAYMSRPEGAIIDGIYSKPWIRDCAVAHSKIIIGEARSKFSQIAGPQGGSTLNGEAMKQEGLAELERLENEINLQIDGNEGYGMTIG
jgi:hypothetical protein